MIAPGRCVRGTRRMGWIRRFVAAKHQANGFLLTVSSASTSDRRHRLLAYQAANAASCSSVRRSTALVHARFSRLPSL